MKKQFLLFLIFFVSLYPIGVSKAEIPVGATVGYTLNVSGIVGGGPYTYNASNFHFQIKSTIQNSSLTQFKYTSDNDTYFNYAFANGLNIKNNTFYINSTGMVPGTNSPPDIPFWTPANFVLNQNYTSGYYFDYNYKAFYYNVTSLNYPYQLKVDNSTRTVETWKLDMVNLTYNSGSSSWTSFYNSTLLFAKNTSTLLFWNFHIRGYQSGSIATDINISIVANQASNIPFVINYPSSSSYSSSSYSSVSSSTSTISLAGFEFIPFLLGSILLAKKYRKKSLL